MNQRLATQQQLNGNEAPTDFFKPITRAGITKSVYANNLYNFVTFPRYWYSKKHNQEDRHHL